MPPGILPLPPRQGRALPPIGNKLHPLFSVGVTETSQTSLLPFAEVRRLLHGVQFVELSVPLEVHQDAEVDGEGQVEVEREEAEVGEKRTWMACG